MRFPQIWHNLTYLAGFFKIVPALIVITSVSQEFAHRTARQNIIDGLSRQQYMLGKLFVVVLLTICSVAFVFGLGMFFGITNADRQHAAGAGAEMVYLAAYAVEFFTYMCYALLMAVLVKRPAVALVLLLVIDIMAEPFLGLFLGAKLRAYMPFMVVDDLIRFPLTHMLGEARETGVQVQKMVLALGYGVVAYLASVAYMKKTNL
jgi:ABC-type transport system involved in multi-copper enzyme maturation permease subunit